MAYQHQDNPDDIEASAKGLIQFAVGLVIFIITAFLVTWAVLGNITDG